MTMFRYSTLSGGENAPVPSGAELIEIVRRRPVWDEITITREDDAQFPRASLSWHEGHGLVLHCFEDDLSWGFFLAESGSLTEPEIDIVLGARFRNGGRHNCSLIHLLALKLSTTSWREASRRKRSTGFGRMASRARPYGKGEQAARRGNRGRKTEEAKRERCRVTLRVATGSSHRRRRQQQVHRQR